MQYTDMNHVCIRVTWVYVSVSSMVHTEREREREREKQREKQRETEKQREKDV